MLLVSCCGQGGSLFLVNEEDGTFKEVFPHGCSGIAITPEQEVFAYSNSLQSITKFNKKFVPIKTQVVGHNFHGMFFYKNELYGIDTYHDRIYRYDTKTLQGIYVWDFGEEKRLTKAQAILDYIEQYKQTTFRLFAFEFLNFLDQLNVANHGQYQVNDCYHINDVFILKGKMYISMFRDVLPPPSPDTFSGKVFIKLVEDQSTSFGEVFVDKLMQPHSPFLYKNEFWICNSRMGSLTTGKMVFDKELQKMVLSNRKEIPLDRGFVRGLLVEDSVVYTGISNSTQRTVPEAFETAKCGVVVLDKKKLKVVNFIPLPANEVYGILRYE